jgi:transposase-like protein
MSNQRYTPEFKDEAARQIVDRGYSVADVSERLGVSAPGVPHHQRWCDCQLSVLH